MFAEQIVDADHGGDGGILANWTDPHGVAFIVVEGLLQLEARGDANPIPERWVDGDAAIEGGVQTETIRPIDQSRSLKLGSPAAVDCMIIFLLPGLGRRSHGAEAGGGIGGGHAQP
jgi:hypothetical protein